MRASRRSGAWLVLAAALAATGAARAQLVISEGTNFSVDVAPAGDVIAIRTPMCF